MSRPTPEQWRKIFQDSETGPPSEERFLPLASRKGLTSGEHLARYLFASAFCEGKRVLDVACGSGYGAYMLKILGAAEVVGVDADQAAIETARRAYETPGLEFRAADATALDPAARPFDVVVSFETIEHVADAEAFLESLGRQLAPAGLLLISCPHDARSPWVSPCHVRHFTWPEFRDLVARYFPDPVPVSQIHAIASLIVTPEAGAADGLVSHPLLQAWLDFAKSLEDADGFLLLCGNTPGRIEPTAVLTKNLTEWVQEIYSAVSYIRDRVPQLESELAEARVRITRQARQLMAARRSLEDQKAYSLELHQQLLEMRYSRTWQLMLACRDALHSPAKLLRLPYRVARILIDPPVAPVSAGDLPATATPVLPQYLPHRRSEIGDWPAGRPLITVGIPCYNYGQFVREAIQSVLDSTFQDFEILVINDGSTDSETLTVLADLEKNPPHPRLRVVHQQNQGLAAARNKGAALGRGKYIVSLDADDRIAPTYLEKTLWVLEHYPHYAFCYSYVQRFGAEDELWKTQRFSLEKALLYNHVPTGAVFRREAWIEAGGFRDELYGQDDWNFWITLGSKGWDGCLIEEPLFYYRIHQTSMWSSLKMAEREHTARRIQSLHAYLTGTGDSRAAEQFNPPRDPMVRAAIDRPELPPADPALPLSHRPHLKFGDGRPGLLFAVPFMRIGGAEQVVLQVMQGLATDYGLAAVTTLDVPHNWEAEFAQVTPWIYHLACLPLGDPAGYLSDLAAAHNIAGVVVSHSALAYQAFGTLKQSGHLWTADLVHNIVPEGYLDTAIREDRHIDCHFALGQHQREALIRKGGIDPGKIHLAPTAADAQVKFNPATYAARLPEIRHQLGIKGGEVVLTYTGRLAVEKDVPLFVRVVGELVHRRPGRKFQAFIAGDGSERARVEHEIRTQGLQGVVELLGYCDNVPEILAVSQFTFLTSHFEGSSLTLLEAMAMRLVMLSTDTGNVREVVEDGVNGFIVPSRSAADFATRVCELLDNPARDAAIRNRARQTILERFDLAAMVRVYAETIAGALAERRQPA